MIGPQARKEPIRAGWARRARQSSKLLEMRQCRMELRADRRAQELRVLKKWQARRNALRNGPSAKK
jgi:hypothetical protein